MSLRITALLALGIGCVCASAAAQRVWVVAPTLGPGVDCTAIQPAIDAAADGDTVLVRAGTYKGFAIIAKGLYLHADGPGVSLSVPSEFTILSAE